MASLANFGGHATDIYSVPPNFLETVDLNYYVPNQIQSGIPTKETEDGKVDVVALLYESGGTLDFGIDQYDIINQMTDSEHLN